MIKHCRQIICFAMGCLLFLAGCNSIDKSEEEKEAKRHAERKAQWFKDSIGVSVNGKPLPTTEVVHIENQLPDARRSPVNPYPIFSKSAKTGITSSMAAALKLKSILIFVLSSNDGLTCGATTGSTAFF